MLQWIPDSPLVSFTILLLVILTVPPIFERLRLPGLVGLLFAGVVLGSDGLGLLDPDAETTDLLSEIGKIYLMFVAGLEIDLAEFRKTKDRSLGFGAATFLVPLAIGTVIGQVFGFGLNASILIGSLFASHTLLGYPIVQRLGLVRNEAVTVTIGATIFTDIAALLVLAICIAIHAGEFSLASLIVQLFALALYAAAVLFGLDWAGKSYFRRTGDEESNQFLFILLAVFLASVGAQLINVDKIVGAFLAGLAVNDVVGHGPVEEKIEFVGSTLFIPFFFVGMGLLLDVPAFVESLTSNLALTLAIVGGLLVSKLLAALVAKLLYRYAWPEMLTMWSLSLPQVAATLAAALAGYGAGLLTESVFNSVIVLMLVTSLLGPLLTERFAVKLPLTKEKGGDRPLPVEAIALDDPFDIAENARFTVLVPIANPVTERNLIELAALLARHESGTIVPLSVVKAHVHMDEPGLTGALRRSHRLLQRAVEVGHSFEVEAQPDVRIDDDVAEGISRAAREANANLIVMGWSQVDLRSRLFGTITDSVFWAAHCPVAVTRLLDEPINLSRILVPVKILTPQTLQVLNFARLFADTNHGSVLVVHIHGLRTPLDQVDALESAIRQHMAQGDSAIQWDVKMVASDSPAQAILNLSQSFDLVILRSMRRRTAGGLAVSDVTTEVIQDIACSMILFGEPHS
ncbi:MAG: cation:proton antiporter [Synechococcales bacterium]|nr:cation:proton antiporter [Synechococcales bacterium]